jgi:hypothetical protein
MISYTIRPYRILTATDRHNIRCELKELISYGIAISLEGGIKEAAKAILAVEFKA